MRKLRRHVNGAAEHDQNHAVYFYGSWVALDALCRYEEALSKIQKAVDLEPNNPGYRYCLCKTLMDTKRYEDSLSQIQVAIDLNPDNAAYHYSLWWTLSTLNRHEEALLAIQRAVELVPDNAEYRFHFGVTLRILGRNSVSVFARDYYNDFSIDTLVWYNLCGNNIQSVTFNVTNLNENNTLNFKVGGRTGSKGGMTLGIYVDRPVEGDADYTYDLEASDIPTDVSIEIRGATSLSFQVNNHAGNENTLVFYDFHV